MAEGLAIASIIVALLCFCMVVWLAFQFFLHKIESKASAEAETQKLRQVIDLHLMRLESLQKQINEVKEEAENGLQTGMYTPVRDPVTKKVEMKLVQDYGDIEGLGFDEIMNRARELANGGAIDGRRP